MNLKTQPQFREIRLELTETSEDQSSSFLSINAADIDWVFAIQGKIKEIVKELDNKTERIYNLSGGIRFLSLLFNLVVIIFLSYSFILLFNKFLRLPEVYSIVLFVVIVQLLVGIIPFLTITRFQGALKELHPRIELVSDLTRMERERRSMWWAVLKHLVLPLIIGLFVAFLSWKFFK